VRLRRLLVARWCVMACAFTSTLGILGTLLIGPFFDEWRRLGSPRTGLPLPLLVFAAPCLGLVAVAVAWAVRFAVWLLFDGRIRRAGAHLRRAKTEVKHVCYEMFIRRLDPERSGCWLRAGALPCGTQATGRHLSGQPR